MVVLKLVLRSSLSPPHVEIVARLIQPHLQRQSSFGSYDIVRVIGCHYVFHSFVVSRRFFLRVPMNTATKISNFDEIIPGNPFFCLFHLQNIKIKGNHAKLSHFLYKKSEKVYGMIYFLYLCSKFNLKQ